MQPNLDALSRKAIDCALRSDWKQAIQINLSILEKSPNNTEGKLRLGRAYLQLGEFLKAKKIFKEVLEVDPINQVAQRNYKLAQEKKVERSKSQIVDTSHLIKEPGTSTETSVVIVKRGTSSGDFVPGEQLILKLNKREIPLTKANSDIPFGYLSPDMVKKLNVAKERNPDLNVRASFLKGNGKIVIVLLKASTPIFKSERQEVRPYIKTGSLEDPEAEAVITEPEENLS